MRRLHDEIIHNPLAHPPGGASPTDRLEAMMADVKLDASSVQARLKSGLFVIMSFDMCQRDL
jgi:hypothetical protein